MRTCLYSYSELGLHGYRSTAGVAFVWLGTGTSSWTGSSLTQPALVREEEALCYLYMPPRFLDLWFLSAALRWDRLCAQRVARVWEALPLGRGRRWCLPEVNCAPCLKSKDQAGGYKRQYTIFSAPPL